MRFSQALQPWSVATPGRIFEKISDAYPLEPEIQQQLQASFQADFEQGPATTFALNQGQQRILYKSSDSSKLVMAAQDHLAASSLEPYEGWASFSDRFRQAVTDVGEVVTLPKVEQMSVRYLNRIVIPGERIDTDDYFLIPIKSASDGRSAVTGFVNRVESALDDSTKLQRTFASLEFQSDQIVLLLDIEVIRTFSKKILVGKMGGHFEALRKIKNDEFENSITDKARELFR